MFRNILRIRPDFAFSSTILVLFQYYFSTIQVQFQYQPSTIPVTTQYNFMIVKKYWNYTRIVLG